MGRWSLDDIPWDRFDKSRINPDIVALIKAAAVVEYNAGDYVAYLRRVFAGDERFIRAAEGWGEEELQHGLALGRWAELADPGFDFAEAFAAFKRGFRLPLEAEASVRGSRTGELIARCMVETGTSSYYSALADATGEPVLQAICRNIASDEFAHYAMFRNHMARYQADEQLTFWRRLYVALTRIREAEDDELAYAYHATNGGPMPYDRAAAIRNYQVRAIPCYQHSHIHRATGMVLAAVGLSPDGWTCRGASAVASLVVRVRALQAARALAA